MLCRKSNLVAWVALLGMASAPGVALAQWSILDGARVHPPYTGQVPKKSDVIFSSRFKRPNALKAAQSFGATRVEWVYATDPAYVASLKKGVGWFGGSLNANAELKTPDGTARDFDGAPLTNPRMKSWNVLWDTTTHPDTRAALQAQAKIFLDLGADSIQFDDPLLQLYAAQLWGGDFNPSTLAGFKKWLKSYQYKDELKRLGLYEFSGDYRDYLKHTYNVKDAKDYARRFKSFPSTAVWLRYIQSTVSEYFDELRGFLDKTAGKRVPLSMNLGLLDQPNEKNSHFFLAAHSDYAIAETSVKTGAQMQMRSETLRALGIGLVPSLKAKSTDDARVSIASFYALGTQPLVPWDIFLGNDATGKAERYFGTVEDYGDLYAFVRANPAIFDGMETAAVVGILVPVDKYDSSATSKLVETLSQKRIPFSFVLAGGTDRKFLVDPESIQHYRAVLTPNPDADYSEEALAAVRVAKVRRVSSAQISTAGLDEFVPFVAAGDASSLRLYPRSRAGSQNNQLVIQVVDEARGKVGASDSSCRRRIGIRKNMTEGRAIREITWFSGRGKQQLEADPKGDGTYFTIPECALWGAVLVQFREK